MRPNHRTRNHFADHVLERAIERWNIALTRRDIEHMSEQVRRTESIFIGDISNTRTNHIVVVNGQEYPVIYNKKQKYVVSVLGPETLSAWKRSYAYVKYQKAKEIRELQSSSSDRDPDVLQPGGG